MPYWADLRSPSPRNKSGDEVPSPVPPSEFSTNEALRLSRLAQLQEEKGSSSMQATVLLELLDLYKQWGDTLPCACVKGGTGVSVQLLGLPLQGSERLRVLEEVASFYKHFGMMQEALGVWEDIIDLQLRTHATTQEAERNRLNVLARAKSSQALVLFNNKKRIEEAFQLYKSAHELYKQANGGEHASVAEAQCGMAWARFKQGRLADAAKHYERALALQVKLLSGDQLVSTYWHLGTVRDEQGLLDEALACYTKALSLHSEAAAPVGSHLIHLCQHIASVHVRLRNGSKALDMYERALAIQRGGSLQESQEKHPNQGGGVLAGSDVAHTLLAMARVQESDICDPARPSAEHLYQQAVSCFGDSTSHPDYQLARARLLELQQHQPSASQGGDDPVAVAVAHTSVHSGSGSGGSSSRSSSSNNNNNNNGDT